MKYFYLNVVQEGDNELEVEIVCNDHTDLPPIDSYTLGSLCLCTDDKSLYILGYTDDTTKGWCKIK